MIRLKRSHYRHSGELEVCIQHAVEQVLPLPAVTQGDRFAADLMQEMEQLIRSLKAHRSVKYFVRRAQRIVQPSRRAFHTGPNGNRQAGLQTLQHRIQRHSAPGQRGKACEQMSG
ncbi:hypothetical protein D3C75_721330 [compost metagenome]